MSFAGPLSIALNAIGEVAGGLQQNTALRAQAAVDDQNAQRTLLQTEQQALQTRRDERRQSGALLAAMAGDGVQLGTGSTADVLAEAAVQREYEILNLRRQGAQQANNLYQAAEDKRHAGRQAIVNGLFGAVAGAINGVSQQRALQQAQRQREKERTTILGGGTNPVPRPSVSGGRTTLNTTNSAGGGR